MRKLQMVDLGTQYAAIRDEVNAGIQEVIDTTQFINGSATKAFASELGQYLGVQHVIPCANGTDALQIALMAIGLEEGDEVITVPFTFVATVEVVALLKGKPVFVDVDPLTFNMDARAIEAKITPRTKAIIPVHLFGQPADLSPIMELAEKHGIYVIEDNAQAIGSNYTFPNGDTVKAGSIGHLATTSFYPTKNLGGYGDGGALFTNDDTLAQKIRIICDHGSSRKYYYDAIGVNSRLDSMQAAILRVKLRNLDIYNMRRIASADQYDALLNVIPGITIPTRVQNATHVFHQYTIRVKKHRDALKDYLQSKGIPSMIYYPVPLHVSDAYRIYGYQQGDFPVSEMVATEVLSLPMHSELDAEQINFICGEIAAFMQANA
ncbi:MAG TPA: DegT/DnrJ/EryC1/StrS family aminotransferase [Chitinophagales bacterium]|nr:DegT/DnrJ/EryC1/StrS family aminotransferase [Chitinophagales bacterium]HNI54441.1 DegT/DnrJ/EryC1/StrS family aminotransferase [Chitinophagales bacterium]